MVNLGSQTLQENLIDEDWIGPAAGLLHHLTYQEFGLPPIGGDNQFRAMANVGQAEVVTWLKQMEIYDK